MWARSQYIKHHLRLAHFQFHHLVVLLVLHGFNATDCRISATSCVEMLPMDKDQTANVFFIVSNIGNYKHTVRSVTGSKDTIAEMNFIG